MHGKSPSITTDPNTVQSYSKTLEIDWFGDKNRVNPSIFNAMILKFFEKFDHQFCLVKYFGISFYVILVTYFLRVTVSLLFR